MRKLFLLFMLFFSLQAFSQQVNGIVVSDTGNVTVIKVWGTHYERGFATGYLLADHIADLYINYIKPMFGSYLPLAKAEIQNGVDIRIDSVYHIEAQGVYNGIDSAGYASSGMDYIDVLVANAFLDLQNFPILKEVVRQNMGCSSLMDWGTATTGTDLDGKSVIARHLDWSNTSAIVNNQVVVFHIPSEADEQPWAMIGFAGQISALSGINNSGLGVFQHMLSDFSGTASLGLGYEPVWFTLRKTLEKKDFNNDGLHDVNDMRDAVTANINGYADGYIISALAPSSTGYDSLTALIAEIASTSPYITFRTNAYPDSMPDDNLYTANYEIARNDHLHFCARYIRTHNGLGSGTNISSSLNWQIMRDSSNSGTSNIQFMQFIPEWRQLKLSVYKSSVPAYLQDPMVFDMDDIFSTPVSACEIINNDMVQVFPNPSGDKVYIKFTLNKAAAISITLFSIAGECVMQMADINILPGGYLYSFDVGKYPDGIYICKIIYNDTIERMKILVTH